MDVEIAEQLDRYASHSAQIIEHYRDAHQRLVERLLVEECIEGKSIHLKFRYRTYQTHGGDSIDKNSDREGERNIGF